MLVPADIRAHLARRHSGPRGPWVEHLVEDEGLSPSAALALLEGWEMIPYVDEKHGHMATLMKKNREVHFAIYRNFRGRGHVNLRRIRQFLAPILERNVFLVTKVGNDEDADFIERLGFQEMGSTIDGAVTTYILNELRHQRKAA